MDGTTDDGCSSRPMVSTQMMPTLRRTGLTSRIRAAWGPVCGCASQRSPGMAARRLKVRVFEPLRASTRTRVMHKS